MHLATPLPLRTGSSLNSISAAALRRLGSKGLATPAELAGATGSSISRGTGESEGRGGALWSKRKGVVGDCGFRPSSSQRDGRRRAARAAWEVGRLPEVGSPRSIDVRLVWSLGFCHDGCGWGRRGWVVRLECTIGVLVDRCVVLQCSSWFPSCMHVLSSPFFFPSSGLIFEAVQ